MPKGDRVPSFLESTESDESSGKGELSLPRLVVPGVSFLSFNLAIKLSSFFSPLFVCPNCANGLGAFGFSSDSKLKRSRDWPEIGESLVDSPAMSSTFLSSVAVSSPNF